MFVPLLTLSLALASCRWLEDTLQKHDLQITHFKETGRGLETIRHRDPGDLLLAVPGSYAISPPLLFERYEHIKNAAEKASQFKSDLTDNQIMALGLLKMQEEGDDPCLCTLPERQYSVSLMPNDLTMCLPPSYQRSVHNLRRYNDELYKVICKCLGEEDTRPTKEEFLWAMASAQSRSFVAEGAGEENVKSNNSKSFRIMLPGIDLINHRHGHEGDLRYNPETKQYEFRSKIQFSAGEEVSFSYGDNADNLTLLLNFGFSVAGNPERIISYDLDDILLAAQRLIPNIFPDEVIVMFKNQLKEEGKYPSSLFAYDGNINSPRSCLADALSIVQSLSERLSEMPLPGLDSAIMRRLLVGRKEELLVCLDRIGNLTIDDKKWHPFVSSIISLLQDEIQTIGET